MKHTPGPWEVSRTCETWGAQLGLKGSDRPNYWGYHLYRNESDVEAEANAHLIAAAPEMLDALYSILNIEGTAILGAKHGDLCGLDVTYHFDKVRDAILKAKGGV